LPHPWRKAVAAANPYMCPRPDLNRRSRLRRGLLRIRLTCGNVLAIVLAGRVSGAELELDRHNMLAQ